MPPVVLALVLLTDPRAKTADVSGGVVTELRGGRAPIVATEEPQPAFLTIVIPYVDLRVRMRRRGAFLFGYAPRIMMRWPNALGVRRPVVLHQLSALYGRSLSRRLRFTGGVSAAIGELDYTANNLVLGEQQAATPQDALVQYAVVDAAGTLQARLTRVDTFAITPAAGYRTPLGEDAEILDPNDPTMVANVLPAQATGSLGLSYMRTASARDTVGVQVTPGVVDFDPGALFFTLDGRLAWTRRLGPRLSSRLDGGAFTAQVLRTEDSLFGATSRVLPVANAQLQGRLLSRAKIRIDSDIGAGVNGFFDVIRGTVQPRAGGTVQVAATLPPDWRVGINTSFYTSATENPQTIVGSTEPVRDETVLYMQAPVTYRIDERMSVEFGAIVTTRAPHMRSEDFRFAQLEVWAYGAFRIAFGTARGGREVTRRAGAIGGLGPNVGTAGLGTVEGREGVREAEVDTADERRRPGGVRGAPGEREAIETEVEVEQAAPGVTGTQPQVQEEVTEQEAEQDAEADAQTEPRDESEPQSEDEDEDAAEPEPKGDEEAEPAATPKVEPTVEPATTPEP